MFYCRCLEHIDSTTTNISPTECCCCCVRCMCRQHSCIIPQLHIILYCKWFSGLGLSSHSICTKFAKFALSQEAWNLDDLYQTSWTDAAFALSCAAATHTTTKRPFSGVFIAICLSCGDSVLLRPPRQFLAIVTQQNACRAYFLGVS